MISAAENWAEAGESSSRAPRQRARGSATEQPSVRVGNFGLGCLCVATGISNTDTDIAAILIYCFITSYFILYFLACLVNESQRAMRQWLFFGQRVNWRKRLKTFSARFANALRLVPAYRRAPKKYPEGYVISPALP